MAQGPVTLQFTGEILGVACGERPSGVKIGRTDGITTMHLIVPQAMAFAPIFAARISVIDTKSDGRICVSAPRLAALGLAIEQVIEEIDEICSAGDRGGVADGDYTGTTITQSRESWEYVVDCSASSRAAIKRIEGARYDWDRRVFRIPHSASAALVAFTEKLSSAAVKKIPSFPIVQGISVERHDAVLHVSFSAEMVPSAKTEILAVPTARRVADICEVSTRYAAALAKALKKIQAETDAWQAAWTAAGIESAPGISVVRRDDVVTLRFDFVEGAGDRLRKMSPWTRWNPDVKTWTLIRPDVVRLRSFVEEFRARDQAAERACREWRAAWAAARVKSTRYVSVRMINDVVTLEFDFIDGAGSRLRAISPRTRWDAFEKCWTLVRPDIDRLRALVEEFEGTIRARKLEEEKTEGFEITLLAENHPQPGSVFEWRGLPYAVVSVGEYWYADASDDDVNSSLCSSLWEQMVVTVRARRVESDKTVTE